MQVIKQDQVQEKIITLRNQRVIIDTDVAELYGVETKRVNEAVKNNPGKFPDGYLIELTPEEWEPLKSKFSTSIKGGKIKLPTAFTEHSLVMLANHMTISVLTTKGQTTIPREIRAYQTLVPLTSDVTELKGILPKPRKKISIKTMNKVIVRRGSKY